MARYRKVDARIWNDEKFCDLSHSGQLVFLFLMTHPHLTALGAMRATIPGLAAELRMTEKDFREAFQEAFRKGMVEHDERASFVALPNFIKFNGPENPNVFKAWDGSLDLLPECLLKYVLIQRVKAFSQGLSKAFQEALPEAFREGVPKGMPKQEQEQEPYQEQEQKPFCVPEKNPKSSKSFVPEKAGANGFKTWAVMDPEERSELASKLWAPIDKHLRASMVPEAYADRYAGARILALNGSVVTIAVQESFLAEYRANAVKKLERLITEAQSDLLRGRQLKLVSIESVCDL